MLCKPWSCQNRWEMEDGKGCRLRGMCWLLEEDESAPGYFWKGAVRLEPKKKCGSLIYSVFFFVFFPFLLDVFMLKMQFLDQST